MAQDLQERGFSGRGHRFPDRDRPQEPGLGLGELALLGEDLGQAAGGVGNGGVGLAPRPLERLERPLEQRSGLFILALLVIGPGQVIQAVGGSRDGQAPGPCREG